MPRPVPEPQRAAIVEIIRRHPEGVGLKDIVAALPGNVPVRTLQYRLQRLVESGHLVRKGERRWARYRVPAAQEHEELAPEGSAANAMGALPAPISAAGEETRAYLRQPPRLRKPAGYVRAFLDAYRPNESFYLSATERVHLATVGKPDVDSQPAGTYARQILDRLLIDLSWNSSRLEGNTYSLLDTRRLIEFGEAAEGRDRVDAQMILNHKDAIEFLVGAAEEIGFNRYTILNLHAILANNLLPDESAAGRLRRIAVGIEKAAFYPLEAPQLIEECFDQLLASAAAIKDPFEQAFFVMVQLPYLQPFDDVNKRVSRLSANIPFIANNLSPLSFTDVPRDTYTEAVLGVYELNRVELLRDVFIWAYERSAARYAAVRQSLGEPDPFRLKHRDGLRAVVAEIIRAGMDRTAAAAHVAFWVKRHIQAPDRERFREIVESELLGLHEGNFARYRVRPGEFAQWRASWGRTGGAASSR